MNVSKILVQKRYIFFALTMVLALVFAPLIPKVNVISEIAYFLPDSSPTKQGLDRIKEEFPDVDVTSNMINVMFHDVQDERTLREELKGFIGGISPTYTKRSGTYILYQFNPGRDLDAAAAKAAIQARYGEDVVVELDFDKNMPANINMMLTVGIALIFIILLIMSASVMEVGLFLVTTAVAVGISMGTNIFREGVSFATNTMVAVLQMILSMDYSIILMNRYRAERKNFSPVEAMETAIANSTPAVLSSAFTTILSLLTLCFMQMKIGADMGIVMAKGVFCSLVCNFTILPTITIWCDKAVFATTKKKPVLPTGKLAKFEYKFRYFLCVAYFGIFVAAYILQQRTEVSFDAIFETTITKIFPQENPMFILYDNRDEDAVPELLDNISRDSAVVMTLSYPSLIKKGYTAAEIVERYGDLAPMLTEDMLSIVYYAQSHPERKEKMNFDEILATIDSLKASGLVPAEVDLESVNIEMPAAPVMPSLPATMPSPAPKPAPVPEPAPEPAPDVPHPFVPAVIDSSALAAQPDSILHPADSILHPADSVNALPPADSLLAAADDLKEAADSTLVAAADSAAVAVPAVVPSPEAAPAGTELPFEITYEFATTQMTARQIAQLLGVDRSLIQTAFRMAGRTRRPATMSPHELSSFLVDKALNDKRYSSFVNAEQKAALLDVHRQLDSAFLSGPSTLIAAADTLATVPATDSLAVAAPADSVLLAAAVPEGPASTEMQGSSTQAAAVPVIDEDDEDDVLPPPTPLERLVEMALSGRRYTSKAVYNALRAAGIKEVSQDELDLLYLYGGYLRNHDPEQRLTVAQILNFLQETLDTNPMLSGLVDDQSREMLSEVREQLVSGANTIKGESISIGMINTTLDFGSNRTFEFLDRIDILSEKALPHDHATIGESAVYREFRDLFPHELLLLSILSVSAIFLIVLLTFRSAIIPLILVTAVMSGVYVDVFVSGIGGGTIYCLAYLIIQAVLMGATIDYSILFMTFYRESRMFQGVKESIDFAYRRSSHSILTSGLIIILAPGVMSYIIDDAMIHSILTSVAIGALAATTIILFLLPGTVAACDRLVRKKGSVK